MNNLNVFQKTKKYGTRQKYEKSFKNPKRFQIETG